MLCIQRGAIYILCTIIIYLCTIVYDHLSGARCVCRGGRRAPELFFRFSDRALPQLCYLDRLRATRDARATTYCCISNLGCFAGTQLVPQVLCHRTRSAQRPVSEEQFVVPSKYLSPRSRLYPRSRKCPRSRSDQKRTGKANPDATKTIWLTERNTQGERYRNWTGLPSLLFVYIDPTNLISPSFFVATERARRTSASHQQQTQCTHAPPHNVHREERRQKLRDGDALSGISVLARTSGLIGLKEVYERCFVVCYPSAVARAQRFVWWYFYRLVNIDGKDIGGLPSITTPVLT